MFSIKKLILIATLLLSTSCEITSYLWESGYKESFDRFLASNDGRFVVFLGKKYHYIFTDNYGVIKELLALDRDNVILIDPKITNLKLDNQNNVYGYIGLKTFDLNLTQQQVYLLQSLGFKNSSEGDLVMELEISGKRYLGSESVNAYFVALEDKYEIEIHQNRTFSKDIEDAALTPLAIAADGVLLFKDILMAPFGE